MSYRLTSTVTLARSDFDSYKSGSHYYVTRTDNDNVFSQDQVKPTQSLTRSLPSWPIAHALPASNSRDLNDVDQSMLALDDDDEIVLKEAKAVRKFRSRSSSGGRRRKGGNAQRKNESRRGSETSIRLPEVKSVFGGTEVAAASHSLATLSLNFHKPHARLAELEKRREAEGDRTRSNSE
ncbi:hypothetical protein PoB_006357600 [Plakobranchus ocellatus]|uniref:Uncharacterized protein n=1 Tax=Plakobranchus ocellatus TaxID=259542 RepID=A0AAV4CZ29_9GAST|nr:hypothetical protein PoB_006357600 [Plakobranchus ocellatus]